MVGDELGGVGGADAGADGAGVVGAVGDVVVAVDAVGECWHLLTVVGSLKGFDGCVAAVGVADVVEGAIDCLAANVEHLRLCCKLSLVRW